jgi:cytochrome P450
MQLGRRHDYLINHPDYIRAILCAPQSEMARSTPPGLKRLLGTGLLTSQGDYHRRHKRMLAPTFHKELVRRWSSTIVNYCDKMRDGWCDSQEIDVEYEMLRLTLAIVLKELLSVDLEQRTDEIARAANTLIEMIHCRTLPIKETGSGGLSDEEIRDEVVTMLVAGHETTAHALTWTWYLLSQHPEIENKLHAELGLIRL